MNDERPWVSHYVPTKTLTSGWQELETIHCVGTPTEGKYTFRCSTYNVDEICEFLRKELIWWLPFIHRPDYDPTRVLWLKENGEIYYARRVDPQNDPALYFVGAICAPFRPAFAYADHYEQICFFCVRHAIPGGLVYLM